ncbi:unnamed protein product [Pneumocystis jirovecii]|uniref:ADF-H domain-containing protein n=1 Tax=Pneumocystis jirovecii TaxID=42068 RepID=L0PDZ4_PNEJI|nr:unnamed protein product [Pneumocystis jirovecii]
MSTISGICAAEGFLSDFQTFLENTDIFAMKISIFQESLIKNNYISRSNDFCKNLESVRSVLNDIEPAYVLCKFQDMDPMKMLLIYYVPENAKIRDKMIYASTRHTLVKSLGSNKILKNVFASNKEEISKKLFEEQLEVQVRENLLSDKEKDLQNAKNSQEYISDCFFQRRHINDKLFLNISEAAKTSIKKLSESTKEFNFVQLANDPSTEILNLEMTTLVEPDNIQHVISSASPRYSIYSWKHTYNDSTVISNMFIYTCPKASTIKERMLYSSTCLLALSTVKQWIHIDKKIETDDLIDINKTMLYSILHPSIEKKEKSFLKPKRPGK